MNITSLPHTTQSPGQPLTTGEATREIRQMRVDKQSDTARPQTEQSVAKVEKPESQKLQREELEEAVKQVNDFLRPINNSIQFNLDDDTGKTIVKVIDLATKDVIRQFPSEEMLAIARAIDKMKGLLVQQKA